MPHVVGAKLFPKMMYFFNEEVKILKNL